MIEVPVEVPDLIPVNPYMEKIQENGQYKFVTDDRIRSATGGSEN